MEHANLPERADVVVIGAGAVGLCAARALQRRGRGVTIIARDAVGVGASAGNAGMIVPSHIVPLAAPGVIAQGLRWLANPESPFYIRPRLSVDLIRWLWLFRRHCTDTHVERSIPALRDLSLASVDLFARLQDDIGDVGYEQTGLLMAYRTEKGQKDNLALADRAQSAGLEIERLDASTLQAREPHLSTDLIGAVLYRQDGRVDPNMLLSRLSTRLERDGAQIQTGVTVAEVRPTLDGVFVDTTRGTIRASQVVLAAGAWSSRLARSLSLRLPMQPAKGYSITVDAPADAPRTPTIFTDDKVTLTPMPGHLRFAGTLSLAGFDPSVDARRAAPIRRLAQTYAPGAHASETWSGYRPCSPDGLPFIGSPPRHPNVLVATGHGMMGVSLAPATGEVIAQMAMGEPTTVDVTPFRPDRL